MNDERKRVPAPARRARVRTERATSEPPPATEAEQDFNRWMDELAAELEADERDSTEG